MSWFNRVEKLNPAQEDIAYDQGLSLFSGIVNVRNYIEYYETLEPVNRAINMLVDDCAEIRFKVGERISQTNPVAKGVKAATLQRLLNNEVNPFQDCSDFKRSLYLDLIIDGNIFVYFDNAHLYRIPAKDMVVHPSTKTYIERYEHVSTNFEVQEIIHIKDNSIRTAFRGSSRLKPALSSMQRLETMFSFQNNFFNNGAIPGIVLRTENALSDKLKERMRQGWKARFNPKSGGRSPMILDNGMRMDALSNVNFRELDFEKSITTTSNIIYKTLGIPPILMDGGNNANIRPNHRLYYLETIMPMVQKLMSGIERYFGYRIVPLLAEIPALQPELSELSKYHSGLVNGGILSPDEARLALNYEPMGGEFSEIRIPANIAGSAVDPSAGGRPEGENND